MIDSLRGALLEEARACLTLWKTVCYNFSF
jgi:hypothetical protein